MTSPPFVGMSRPFWALCLLLIAAFALGGGARGDIRSLMVLRPLAVLLLGYGLLGLNRAHIVANRFLFGMAGAMLGLLLLHLVPLPPGWWIHLPGRDLISRIDQAAGLGALWRPLSMAPDASLNALFASLVPLAALVLGVQLDVRERHSLLALLLVLGGISAMLGLAQILGGPHSSLRFYKVTNDFGAVGLFANRNHQALLLAMLLPMIATWIGSGAQNRARAGSRAIPGLLAGLALVPFILVTGSRAGLFLAFVAVLMLPAVIRLGPGKLLAGGRNAPHGSGLSVATMTALGAVLVGALLVGLTIGIGRGVAVERLLASAPGEDLRLQILPTLAAMIAMYFPLGSGLGSFERVYQVHEPPGLLIPTYANHAHNDWVEVLITGGIPALLILIGAIAACLVKARELFAAETKGGAELRFGRLGLAVILLSSMASLVDYPLRVPSLGCLFVVGLLWISCPLPKNQPISLPS